MPAYDMIDLRTLWLLSPDRIAARVHDDSLLRGLLWAVGERDAGLLKASEFVTWLPQSDVWELPQVNEWPREMSDEGTEDGGNTERHFSARMKGQMTMRLRIQCADRARLYERWIPRILAALWHQLGAACRAASGQYIEPDAEIEATHQYLLDITVSVHPGESVPTARAESITQATTSTPVIGS